MEQTDPPNPLKIIIVGAGIGGLTAAIGLRRNGHKVHIYDQSRLASEFGAAIHLCPNASGILRQWGIFAEQFGANPMSRFIERAKEGHTLKDSIDLTEINKRWVHPWHLVHRVALHSELKKLVLSPEGGGEPVELVTSRRVVGFEPEEGKVMFEDGGVVEGDVVVGADGIYSLTRKYIKDVPLSRTGKAAFRFMIPRSIIEADPTTAPLVDHLNAMAIWFGDDRRVIMYPCENNQLLNFVGIHPDTESHAVPGDEWNKTATLDQVLKVFADFDPRLHALILKADPSTLKVWQLLDMEKLPGWTSGKLVLLGDAAHPFTPHQAQGAAQAIEDAAALASILTPSTTPEEVRERIKLYESIRFERAHTIQHYSRLAGQDWVDGKPPLDMMKFQQYNFGHDELAHASAALKQWESARTCA